MFTVVFAVVCEPLKVEVPAPGEELSSPYTATLSENVAT